MNLPYFWDKTPETVPQPELNPLSNPALERNLSRWAEAYFNNPPGKREQAISKLLQEIKNETSEILIAEKARRESSARSSETTSAGAASTEAQSVETKPPSVQPLEAGSSQKEFANSASAEKPNAICSVCKSENPPGNKFCGQCGAARSVAGEYSRPAGAPFPVPPTFAPWNRDNHDSAIGDDVQWLRDRSLGSLYAADAPQRHGWKYALAGLTILLAAFAYLQWDSSLWTWLTPPSTVVAPATTASQPKVSDNKPSSASNQKPVQSISADSSKPATRTAKESDSNRREPMSAGIQPASQKASLLRVSPASRTTGNIESGSGELQLAQRYLGGSMGARDSSEAAKLLWKAVRQQNTTAAVLLSGLYARGDGVPKNCDQASLLLVAAAKRGAAQAAEQLRNLESRGCQ